MRNLTLAALLTLPAAHARADEPVEADVCVFGGTSGGVVAAVQTARLGKTAVVLEPGKHLGGMTSGGLSAVDIGDPRTVGGIAREYFTRLAKAYGKELPWEKRVEGVPTGGAFAVEPHAAEELFDAFVREAGKGVRVLRDARPVSVKKDGPRLAEVKLADGRAVRAKVFIDASYEGDLLALAGVTTVVGREANKQYGETLNGWRISQPPLKQFGPIGPNGRDKSGRGAWMRTIALDPYLEPGKPESGLLPLISPNKMGTPGEAAPGVQAYCYRLCLTDDPANRLPLDPPKDYDPKRYELYARYAAACLKAGDPMDLRWFCMPLPLPNGKWDFNTAWLGANLPGAGWGWAEASYDKRKEIAKQHEDHQRGMIHFLRTDERIPKNVRDEFARFGLPKDEFKDTGGWPHQLYIREARRMVSDVVMTEHHAYGKKVAADPVGLASYGVDAHEAQRIAHGGIVVDEGKLMGHGGIPGPYPVGYGAIVPKAAECDNLFATFCISASHVCFASTRMEPVLMMVSQSAATAGCQAIDDGVPVQKVDYAKLRKRIAADGIPLAAPGKQPPEKKPAEKKPLPAPPRLTKPDPKAAAALAAREYDVVVVGGTPGGVACAVRSAREGLKVLLVNHNEHLGGIVSSGLGVWDTIYDGPRSPVFDELRRAIVRHYRDTYGEDSPQYRAAVPGKDPKKPLERGTFEGYVAEREVTRLVANEPNVAVLPGYYPSAAERDGRLVRAVTLREMDGKAEFKVAAKVFVDATYEGDLAAAAKVPYRIGREGRKEFGEEWAGKIFTNYKPLDAAAAESMRKLGLRQWTVNTEAMSPDSTGEADRCIQAFNYRPYLTDDPANRVEITKPAGYRREPYLDYHRRGIGEGPINRKTFWNAPLLVGGNHDYPDADWPTRRKIADRHWDWAVGWLYFLQHDESNPEAERKRYRAFGLAKDEFADNGHRPYEMYVREARRIEGRAVFTEHDGRAATGYVRAPIHSDSVAVTEWPLDSHACTTDGKPGFPYDGKVILSRVTVPGQIPYRCLLPKDLDNLLVPVCLSASHVGWGTVRLEPVWMQTGEASGYAASLALKGKTTPGQLDPDRLSRTLADRGFLLSYFADAGMGSGKPWVPAVQYLGAKGFVSTYDARPDGPLVGPVAREWAKTFGEVAAGTSDPDARVRALKNAVGESKEKGPVTVAAFADLLVKELSERKLAGGFAVAREVERLKLDGKAVPTRGDACRLVYAVLGAAR